MRTLLFYFLLKRILFFKWCLRSRFLRWRYTTGLPKRLRIGGGIDNEREKIYAFESVFLYWFMSCLERWGVKTITIKKWGVSCGHRVALVCCVYSRKLVEDGTQMLWAVACTAWLQLKRGACLNYNNSFTPTLPCTQCEVLRLLINRKWQWNSLLFVLGRTFR